MLNMLLAAVSCSALLAPGAHTIECTSSYEHIVNGVQYESTKVRDVILFNSTVATCSGEGHPYKVVMKDNGEVVCGEEIIFMDNFESGDTGAWD